MTATTDGDTDAPLPIDYSVPDDVDDEAAKVLAVHLGVIKTLEMLKQSINKGQKPEMSQRTVDQLEAAHRTGERIQEHPTFEEFLAAGPSALPDSLAAEIRETFSPVAEFYGVEREELR